ncbi:hypothetical protein ABT168_02835 [Streptomyces sp. NPDC001793]|uniref:hypothetical protein n=1 Tax=Streptomyces sp. NPDC001793 TaxID=3154657 RepID=UPI00331EACB9
MLSSKRRSAPVVTRGIDHVIVGSILFVGMGLPVVLLVSIVDAPFQQGPMTALRRGRRVIDVLASSSAA